MILLDTVFPSFRGEYLHHKTLLFLILFFSTNGIALSQSILVQDEKGYPLEFAYITNITSQSWSISNHKGNAPLPDKTTLNDTLEISRYGYISVLSLYEHKDLLIKLETEIISFPPIVVHNDTSHIVPGPNIIDIKKKIGFENITHKEYLELLPGVQLRSFGGPGSVTTVSINGGPTSQTKVKVNGFDLTNMQTGVTDLSQIPNPFINNARIIPNGSDLIGSGSQNGILELDLWKPNNSVSHSRGSFGQEAAHLQYSWFTKYLHSSLILGFQNNEGNYKVSWREETFKRENNHFKQLFGSLKFNGRIKPNLFFKGFALSTHQKRGVPGLVWSPSRAFHKDNLLIFGSSLNWVSSLGKGDLKYIYRFSNDDYRDPTYSQISINKLQDYSFIFSQPILKTKLLTAKIRSKIDNHSLESNQNNYRKVIFTENIDLDIKISKILRIKPSLQKNYSRNSFDKTTYSIIGSLKFQNYIIEQISIATSSHYRSPTFNDLYWSPGGNLNLKPESGLNNSISVRIIPTMIGMINFNVFNSKTNDLIQWTPIQSYWQAKNVENVNRYGLTGNWNFKTKNFNTVLTYSHIRSSIGNDGENLRYSPRNIGTIHFELKIKNWTCSSSTHFTDKMIAMYSYPRDNIIPASSLNTFNISKKVSVENFDLITVFSVLNTLNNQYESSKGYPEPGRSLRISLTLNKKRNT